jgi:4'-phosphopantetheinyl transferase
MTAASGGWRPPPATLDLPPEEVHVWRVSLDVPEGCLADLRGCLAADELARADRFHFEQHRRRFVAARGSLRTVLARYLACDPAELRFRYGAHGKPALADAGALDVRFNLSHSGDGTVLAVTRGRDLGIDLERLRSFDNFEDLAGRFFAPREVAALAEVPAGERVRAFFACWTRKEAFIKASGEGLARPLDGFVVSLRAGEPARLLDVEDDPEEASRWSFRELLPWAGYVACVAVREHGLRLRCWDGAAGGAADGPDGGAPHGEAPR